MKKTVGLLLLASGFLLAAKPATAAGDIYVRFPGITGPSTATGHVGDIPAFSFSAGVSAKKGAGATCSDLSFMKRSDQTSPLLFATVLAGVDFPTVTLFFRGALDGNPPSDFYKIVLNNVSITSVQDSGSGGGDDAPSESVSMHASSWVTTYTPSVGPPITTTVTCK